MADLVLLEALQPAPDWALFLDFDGTLVELMDDPEAVRLPNDVGEVLQLLSKRLGGAVALVSGRSLAQLDRFTAPLVFPAAGLHGFERRSKAGGLRLAGPAPDLARVRLGFADYAGRHPGTFVEDKAHAVGLHYRARPELAVEVRHLAQRLADETGPDVEFMPGKMLVEIRPRASGKGQAIAALMEEAPFCNRCPVFAGDDVTDEGGFEVVNEQGGHSIHVGPPKETAARYQSGSVADFRTWLMGLPARLGVDREVSA